jgi:uncharacterized protein (DUF58 family)
MEQKPEIRLKLNSWFLPAIVGLLVAWQLIAPYRGLVILLVGLGGAWLIGYLWARSLARGLRLTRQVRFDWAQVGDRLEERFALINDQWVSALWVEIVDHSTMSGYEVGRATGIAGNEAIRWSKKAICTRRGLFTLGPTSLLTGDPFGVYTVSLHYAASIPFMVMPPVVPLPTIDISPGGRVGEGRPRANAPERTVSTASVREYAPGDSLRWVHWPTSAEHSVILAASLADQELRSGRAVGLMAHGEDLIWLPPRGGEGRRWEILRALARVSPGERALSELLARMEPALGQHASLIIITPAVDGEWIEALVPLLRRGVAPTVLLLDPISFGGVGSVRRITASLSDLGVAHHVITRDLLDRPEARPGRQGRWEWRVGGTGRAAPVHRHRDVAWKALV